MISGLFRRRSNRRLVDRLHGEIVAAVRQRALYSEFGVADTFEGRFEMLTLHAFLVVRRLKSLDAESSDLAQELTDALFRHLDIALREMGVSDIGVPKQMKKLAGGYLGRAQTYAAALDNKNAEALAEAISRNVFGGARQASSPETAMLVRYFNTADQTMSQTPAALFIAGKISFPSAADFAGERNGR